MSLTESGTSSSIGSAWDRYAVAYQNAVRLPTDVVSYGPGVGTEEDIKLLGTVKGKRVLDLGCGGAQSLMAMARQGAIAIGVDISVEQIAYARRLMEQEEIRVELRHGDLAELAFQRADTVDMVFSAMSLQYVPDLNRVFRQVHRVLKPSGTFVFSMPHPAASVANETSSVQQRQGQLDLDAQSARVERSYFERSPMEANYDGSVFTEYHRTISDIVMGLVRAGFDMEVMMEPQGKNTSPFPAALVIRARKEN